MAEMDTHAPLLASPHRILENGWLARQFKLLGFRTQERYHSHEMTMWIEYVFEFLKLLYASLMMVSTFGQAINRESYSEGPRTCALPLAN